MRQPRARPGSGERIGQRAPQHRQLRGGPDVEAGQRVRADGHCHARERQHNARQPPRGQAFIGEDHGGHKHREHRRGRVEDGCEPCFDELLAPGHQDEGDHVVQNAHHRERAPDAEVTRDRETAQQDVEPKNECRPEHAVRHQRHHRQFRETQLDRKEGPAPQARQKHHVEPGTRESMVCVMGRFDHGLRDLRDPKVAPFGMEKAPPACDGAFLSGADVGLRSCSRPADRHRSAVVGEAGELRAHGNTRQVRCLCLGLADPGVVDAARDAPRTFGEPCADAEDVRPSVGPRLPEKTSCSAS
jgi:hypothetical protein